MNLNINVPGILQVNLNGGPNSIADMVVVPQPIPKNYGIDNQNLFPNDEMKKYSLLKNVSVTIGTLGSFLYDQPRLVPKLEEPLAPPPPQMNTKNSMENFTVLTQEQCKDALIKYSNSKCCGTSKPAVEGNIMNIVSYNSFRYKLETFNETRSLALAYSACIPGQQIDRLPIGQQYPYPYSLPCQPSVNFRNDIKLINFPHTDVLQYCFRCNGYGELKCTGCLSGKVNCNRCQGTKFTTVTSPDGTRQEMCPECGGQGKKACTNCSGDGRIRCNVCNGIQVLKWFLQVKVTYVNHVDEFLQERTEMPDEIIKQAVGETLVQNEGVQVSPITDSDNPDVNSNSALLIQKSQQTYSQEKRILQRHELVCVSCNACEVMYKDKTYKFWVLGNSRTVYCPNYPGNCCCTII